jgi:phosphatidylinositol-3-phosphatase
MSLRRVLTVGAVALLVSTCAVDGRQASTSPEPVSARAGRWHHVVIVVEENHAYGEIIGNRGAPYLNHLAGMGASFTRSYAVTHPSEPNYLALFSGSVHHVDSDACPVTVRADNLGHQLRASGHRFAGYSEGLPYAGDPVCSHGAYARKHSPWTDFAELPGSVSRPLRRMPSNYQRLPTVSFVIPDLDHDMHDGTIAAADQWLRAHLGGYARWARRHHSLLIVTWDEDDQSEANRIPTIAVGAGVRRERVAQRITHYSMLRTIEDAYHLRPLGAAAHARGIVRLGG